MSSPKKDSEEAMPSNDAGSSEEAGGSNRKASAEARPPAKRRLSAGVIEISDTESDDSDICAVTTYQASADEVKRIRGAEYSSSSSSSDSYSSESGSESPWEDDSLVLAERAPGGPPRPPRPAPLLPRAPASEHPLLNARLKSQEVIEKLKTHWKEHKDLDIDEVTLTCSPFRLCLLHDLLENSDIVNNIVDDMNTLDWERKKMDLYEFHQTVDLANLTWQRSIKGIYELLKNEVMAWAAEVTGLRLSAVSASCSLYGPGDHLLPHDDRRARRRLAFVLYLAPWSLSPPSPSSAAPAAPLNGDSRHIAQGEGGWGATLGGALQLLARDEGGRPRDVTRAVLPRNNMLALFPVGPDSFHQVAEVVSLELPRLSINGWFHGEAPPEAPAEAPDEAPAAEDPAEAEAAAIPSTPLHTEIVLVEQWVAESYMSPATRGRVQTLMERDSQLQLTGLLLPERLRRLLPALAAPDMPWEGVGPADARRYSRARAESLPATHPAAQLLRLAGSAAWGRLLRDCTDLALVGHTCLELQRWQPGDFTLLPPRAEYSYPRLEALLYLRGEGAGAAGATLGGHTTFVAPEDDAQGGDGALVTVRPDHNALSLVYCEAGAAAFTKYLSRSARPPTQPFYLLRATYVE